MTLRWLLQVGRNALIALVVIAIGEMLPPLQALEAWLAPRRTAATGWVGGVAFAGWAIFMAAVVYRILTGGGSLTREEIARHVKSVNDGLERPYVFRVSRYWIPKRVVGAGFSDALSIRQFKEAWAAQLWRGDSRWRGLFAMAFGAALMAVGAFGLPVVLGSPGIKLLCGGALGYAVVRVFWAFLKA